MGSLVFCGANGIRWLETNSGFRTPQRGIETGSNSPVDCCVSENRASPKAGPRWDGFWIPVARFSARVRVAALSAASEPSQAKKLRPALTEGRKRTFAVDSAVPSLYPHSCKKPRTDQDGSVLDPCGAFCHIRFSLLCAEAACAASRCNALRRRPDALCLRAGRCDQPAV